MRFKRMLGVAAIVGAFAFSSSLSAHAQVQASSSSPPAASSSPDPALTQRFQAFFEDVLVGKPPTQNLAPVMQDTMTASALAPIKQFFASLGTFQQLQYVGTDQLRGYQRYHYNAIFSNGSQKVMFVLDPTGAITGFFNE